MAMRGLSFQASFDLSRHGACIPKSSILQRTHPGVAHNIAAPTLVDNRKETQTRSTQPFPQCRFHTAYILGA
jgi:hypothetical protein